MPLLCAMVEHWSQILHSVPTKEVGTPFRMTLSLTCLMWEEKKMDNAYSSIVNSSISILVSICLFSAST
jgi:hypothetical protein